MIHANTQLGRKRVLRTLYLENVKNPKYFLNINFTITCISYLFMKLSISLWISSRLKHRIHLNVINRYIHFLFTVEDLKAYLGIISHHRISLLSNMPFFMPLLIFFFKHVHTSDVPSIAFYNIYCFT